MSVVSVKERAKHLNRMESEAELIQQTSASSLGAPYARKNLKDAKKTKEDDDSSTGSGYVTLDAKEKEWLVVSSSADYHAMHQLLSKQPELAKIRDFTSGHTALHWAAKHGRPEVIKMLIGKPGVMVNQKTNGGYTPLHLAAIHGHEEVIELLIQTYKADPNIRDYSGKKAKQYLKNSASSRAQQLLVSSRLSSKGKENGSGEGNFTRNTTGRRSNRARALTSLIQGTAAGLQNAMMRTSWGSTEDVSNTTQRSTPNSSPRNSAEPSPVSRSKGSFTRDREMMPPPSAPSRRQKKPHSISKESLMTEDKRQSSGKQVLRSESEPNLGETIQPSRTTFI